MVHEELYVCPQPLDTDSKVWRYLDFSKLINGVSRESLFLSRADLLGDLHEGSITRIDYELRNQIFPEGLGKEGLEMLQDINKNALKNIYVNCWRLDNSESEAMWKLYCPNNKGVAIQTTYRKLSASVSNIERLYIGTVTYLDYRTQNMPRRFNALRPIMHKRKAFEHEKEVRIVKVEGSIMNSSETPKGIEIKWDFSKAVENVYVNPYAPEWYYETVVDVLKKYKVALTPIWSDIKNDPIY